MATEHFSLPASVELRKENTGLYVHRNHSGLLRTGKLGVRNFISNIYSLQCNHQNDSALRWESCVSHYNVSLTVWAKSQDSVHKPQFLKRKESRSGSNQGPSAYQPSALPLGHTGSRIIVRKHWASRPQTPLRLIRDGEVGKSGNFIFNTYSLHYHHQNDSALTWAAV